MVEQVDTGFPVFQNASLRTGEFYVYIPWASKAHLNNSRFQGTGFQNSRLCSHLRALKSLHMAHFSENSQILSTDGFFLAAALCKFCTYFLVHPQLCHHHGETQSTYWSKQSLTEIRDNYHGLPILPQWEWPSGCLTFSFVAQILMGHAPFRMISPYLETTLIQA